MKVHIQLDKFDRGIVFWIFDEPDGIGPYRPQLDPFGLNNIDSNAEYQLRQFLEIAAAETWNARGWSANELASNISAALSQIQQTLPHFNEEPVITCPEPLSKELGCSNQAILISQWISDFPPIDG